MYFTYFTLCKIQMYFNRQPTVPPQTDSTHARPYTTYSTHNSSSMGLLLHKRGPTRSYYVWHRQPNQHAAFLHPLRYSTRQFCTASNSTQTDSTMALWLTYTISLAWYFFCLKYRPSCGMTFSVCILIVRWTV